VSYTSGLDPNPSSTSSPPSRYPARNTPEALEEFEWRHVGRAPEMAYKARDQAGSPAAKPIVNSGDAPESFAG